jgi:hypothetical protein
MRCALIGSGCALLRWYSSRHRRHGDTRPRDRDVGQKRLYGRLRGSFRDRACMARGGLQSRPYLATWGMLEWWKPIAIILMLPAALLVVIGLTTPNPTSVAQEGRIRQPPQGIVRITRHPFLTGVGLWALVHLIGTAMLHPWSFLRPGRSSLSLVLCQSIGSVGGFWAPPGSRLRRRPPLFRSQPSRRGETGFSARDRALALGRRPPRLRADAERPRAGHRRLTISRVGCVRLPARQQPHGLPGHDSRSWAVLRMAMPLSIYSRRRTEL